MCFLPFKHLSIGLTQLKSVFVTQKIMKKQYQAHYCMSHSKYETVMQNVRSSSDFYTRGGFIENM